MALMSYAAHEQRLEAASERFSDLIAQLTNAAEAGRDSVEYASKVAVLAQQFALASTDFCEALSIVHCDNLSIHGEIPNENPDDLADWAKRVAHDRTYVPFEGVRSVRRAPVPAATEPHASILREAVEVLGEDELRKRYNAAIGALGNAAPAVIYQEAAE
jgi:hypothetical protein